MPLHFCVQLLAFSGNRGPLACSQLSTSQFAALLLLPLYSTRAEDGTTKSRIGSKRKAAHGSLATHLVFLAKLAVTVALTFALLSMELPLAIKHMCYGTSYCLCACCATPNSCDLSICACRWHRVLSVATTSKCMRACHRTPSIVHHHFCGTSMLAPRN